MNNTKKKILIIALAVCLVAIVSMGTLAWFSASDKIVNDFHVATDSQSKTDFSVDVVEEVTVGDNITANNNGGYTYNKVLPGDTLEKKVEVKNTGAYDQYIRVLVEISDGAKWSAALGADYQFENCFIGFDPTMWVNIDTEYDSTADKIIVVAYYKDVLTADSTNNSITLFEKVKIPEELTVEESNALGCSFDITVKAHAIQSENVGTDVWAAFNTVVKWDYKTEYAPDLAS